MNRQLPWDTEGVVCDIKSECYIPGNNWIRKITVDETTDETALEVETIISNDVSQEISPKQKQGAN